MYVPRGINSTHEVSVPSNARTLERIPPHSRSVVVFIGLARWLLCLVPTTSNSPATMGILISRLFEGLFGSKEVRILILGLDNAGKTTILYRLQNESDEAVQTIPTIGFNVETLQYKNIKVRQRTSRAGGADGWRRRRRGRPAGGGGTLVIWSSVSLRHFQR